jgi:hypothetical protein
MSVENGQRIGFLPGTAARAPDLDGRPSGEHGQHLLAERQEEFRIAEHVADLDGQELQQHREGFRFVQHAFLQPRQRRHAE